MTRDTGTARDEGTFSTTSPGNPPPTRHPGRAAGTLQQGKLGSPVQERVRPTERHGVCHTPNDSTVPAVSPPQQSGLLPAARQPRGWSHLRF